MLNFVKGVSKMKFEVITATLPAASTTKAG